MIDTIMKISWIAVLFSITWGEEWSSLTYAKLKTSTFHLKISALALRMRDPIKEWDHIQIFYMYSVANLELPINLYSTTLR